MSVKDEIRAVIDVIDRMPDAGPELLEVGRRMRARLDALARAPAGAGWEWLAARGDAAAALAAEAERRECAGEVAGVEEPPEGRRES